MTETEAKTKWCPMTKFVPSLHPDPEIAGMANAAQKLNCIGSDCMMWRPTNTNLDGTVRAKFDGDAAVPEGYCGLAGKL